MGMLQLQRHGGRPVALVGGGTGMIGDPSGRSAERNLLDRETLAANVVSIQRQLERFLDFAGPTGAVVVNNLDWLGEIQLIDWLRDVGKHFTIPYMLAKDSVQVRLDRGLSFTEFSYMLIQATDFEHLHRTMGVELQMGGADQWGNITAGLELIRRRAGEGSGDGAAADSGPDAGGEGGSAAGAAAEAGVDDGGGHAHGLAYQLLLSASGTKFGKTAGGESIWLDASQTSPYAFYQYWLNVDDRDVGTYLRWFTLLPRAEIEALEQDLAARPEGAQCPTRAGPRRDRADPRRRRGRACRAGQRSGVLARADPRSGGARDAPRLRSAALRSATRMWPAARSRSPARPGCSARRARRVGRSPRAA